jgi:hypothetical protein
VNFNVRAFEPNARSIVKPTSDRGGQIQKIELRFSGEYISCTLSIGILQQIDFADVVETQQLRPKESNRSGASVPYETVAVISEGRISPSANRQGSRKTK